MIYIIISCILSSLIFSALHILTIFPNGCGLPTIRSFASDFCYCSLWYYTLKI